MGYGFTDPYRSVTRGLIAAKYAALGARSSVLGAPRSGEMAATTAGTSAVQWFERGRLYWRNDIGAFEVHGAIGGKYFGLGSVTSFLGYPVTDETATPDGAGRFNHFQGGSIYWSPVGQAHAVYGAIRDKWSAMAWERGFLGYPISDEVGVTGGRASQFQGGNVYWSAGTAAHEVHGAILSRYLQFGGTGSTLGLPVSDEYDITGGRRSDFQHGAIEWNATTGVVTVVTG
ncbi:LGFP repeat-containing protein [Nocardia sp. IFM 10818]